MDLRDMTYHEKVVLAKNPNTSLAILRKIAKDTDYLVRGQVALHSKSTEDILRDLARDRYPIVREAVALQSNIPDYLFRELAKDTSWSVRRNVIYNTECAVPVLIMIFEYEKSFKEPSKHVIKALYENEKLPIFAKRIIETLYGELRK